MSTWRGQLAAHLAAARAPAAGRRRRRGARARRRRPAISAAACAWRRCAATSSAIDSGSSASRCEFRELVLAASRCARRGRRRAQQFAPARARPRPALRRRRDSRRARPHGRRRHRAAPAGCARSTAAPGARAGRGSRPAARRARASCASVAGRPLIQAREPPSARSARRNWQLRRRRRRVRCRAARRARPGASASVELRRPARRARRRAGPCRRRRARRTGKQRVDQQRLAGAGFAGDHGQAGAEVAVRRGATTAKSWMVRWVSMGRLCGLPPWPSAPGGSMLPVAPQSDGRLRRRAPGLYRSHEPKPDPIDRALDPRARQLLRTLIAQLHPRRRAGRLAARWRAHAGLDVSPATIRNIMADLEDIGPAVGAAHLGRPHPDRAGLSRVRRLAAAGAAAAGRRNCSDLRSELPAGAGTQALLGNASELLSAMTHFVGVVSVPQREQFAFRHDRLRRRSTRSACW